MDMWGIGQAGHDFTTQWIKPVIDWYWSKKASERQFDYFKKSLNYQYKMYDKYNSPAAQMQRYRNAGLNPNLIYGSTSGAYATGGTPMMHVNAPEFDAGAGPDLGEIMRNISDAKKKQSEIVTPEDFKHKFEVGIAHDKAETDKVKAETDRVKEETEFWKKKNKEADATGTVDQGLWGRAFGKIRKWFGNYTDEDRDHLTLKDLSGIVNGNRDWLPSDTSTRSTRFIPDSTQGRQGLTILGEQVEGRERLRLPLSAETDGVILVAPEPKGEVFIEIPYREGEKPHLKTRHELDMEYYKELRRSRGVHTKTKDEGGWFKHMKLW